jgi:hypothetical protein
MWTLPIPPDDPLLFGQPPTPEVPPPIAPQIVSSTATPAAGGACTFVCTEDVACNAILDYGPDNTYGTSVNTMDSGQGTTSQSVALSGFTGGNSYHYRFRVTGTTPPNDVETIGADATFVAIA